MRVSFGSEAGTPGRIGARCKAVRSDWRETSRPIKPGSSYPAKEFCSNCGLCDTYYIAHVKDACAFLGDGTLQHSALTRLSAREREHLSLRPCCRRVLRLRPKYLDDVSSNLPRIHADGLAQLRIHSDLTHKRDHYSQRALVSLDVAARILAVSDLLHCPLGTISHGMQHGLVTCLTLHHVPR